ncbi:MAG TPA: YwiC-like family protein, partial [Candidatus Acidoferrales bacterium]|nr:YwiC-like family protein [Candidatus Acidoferrales bacterium]
SLASWGRCLAVFGTAGAATTPPNSLTIPVMPSVRCAALADRIVNVKATFFPREHGATAMLLTPFFCAAILLRQVRWTEAVALIAGVSAFAAKDPLVAMVRQRLVWKHEHPETRMARRWLAVELLGVAAGGAMLAIAGPWRPFAVVGLAAAGFALLAVWVNVRNRQRSEWFQVASAAALSSTSLVACLAVLGDVPRWGWWLWLLCAMQAAAGIFVVHARLDARSTAARSAARNAIRSAVSSAARSPAPTGEAVNPAARRAAHVSVAVLAVSAIAFWRNPWIAAALLIVAGGYWWELRRQRDVQGVQMPLARVGMQMLALSILYGALIVAGLWSWRV